MKPRGIFKTSEFTNNSGETTSWRVSGTKLDGTRVQENFSTEAEAVGRRQALEIEAANGKLEFRTAATRLSPEQLSEAERVFAELAGKSLTSAVRYYLANYREPARKVRVKEAFDLFISAKELEECRKGTLRNLRARIGLLVNRWPERLVSDITRADILEILGRPKISRATKDNDRRALSSFFSWCCDEDEERGYCAENPASKKGKKRRNGSSHTTVTLLDIGEIRKLLRAALVYKDGRLVPFVTLALFCGIRPDEIKRLTWSDIDLQDAEINISPEVSKVHSQRTVAISDNALEWLLPHAMQRGPVVQSNWRKDFDAVKRMAGFGNPERPLKKNESPAEKQARQAFKEWPQDAMRHTALSYHVRKHGSEEKTATWAGNSVNIIRNHYKNKVSKTDCAAFWAITPQDAERKILTPPFGVVQAG